MRLYFEETQSNGDATKNYNVTFSEKNLTVENFCNAVLARTLSHSEHGHIYISEPGDPWHATICEYYHAVMEFKREYDNYCNQKVISVVANGGYGAMSYWLTVE